eukprot:scaffold165576_cov21-Tisochrysis_lutea.AAC.2
MGRRGDVASSRRSTRGPRSGCAARATRQVRSTLRGLPREGLGSRRRGAVAQRREESTKDRSRQRDAVGARLGRLLPLPGCAAPQVSLVTRGLDSHIS